ATPATTTTWPGSPQTCCGGSSIRRRCRWRRGMTSSDGPHVQREEQEEEGPPQRSQRTQRRLTRMDGRRAGEGPTRKLEIQGYLISLICGFLALRQHLGAYPSPADPMKLASRFD